MPGAIIDDRDWMGEPPAVTRRDGSVALFLSLYLLLLAFFILLVAISNGESVKSREIMEGVSSQFAAQRPPRETTRFTSDLGTFVSPSAFMNRVTEVYETAIPAARITKVSSGRLMELRFHVDSLFEHDTDTLRPAQRRAIAQLVSSLSSPPPGLRYEAEAIFSVPAAALPVAEDRAMRRAGVVARAFVEQGAPMTSVAVALEEGDPLQARLVFRVVEDKDAAEGTR